MINLKKRLQEYLSLKNKNRKKCELTYIEEMILFMATYIISCLIMYIFYRNIYISSVLGFISIAFMPVAKNYITEKRRSIILNRFKDFLHDFSIALETGDNVYNALKTARCELEMTRLKKDIFLDKLNEVIILNELGEVRFDIFKKFGIETELEDIVNFADTFEVCMITGGNIIDIMKESISIISSKIELDNEIKLIFSEKKAELVIIALVPLGLYILLSVTCSEYLKALYTTLDGLLALTISIAMITLGIILGSRILDVK